MEFLSQMDNSRGRAILNDLLQVPSTYNELDIMQAVLPASTASKMPCCYFTMNQNVYNETPGTRYGDPHSHNDPVALLAMAFILTGTANASIKFAVKGYHACHRIQNPSNSVVTVTGYKCRWRRDVPLSSTYATFPLALLGRGFLNASAGTGADTANTFLTDARSTPFMSPDFVLQNSILKIKKVKIQPGQQKKFYLKHSKDFTVHPNLLLSMTTGQTYNTGTQVYDFQQGGEYWLFKLETEQLQGVSAAVGNAGVSPNSVSVRMETETSWTFKAISITSSNTVNVVLGAPVSILAASGLIQNVESGFSATAGSIL